MRQACLLLLVSVVAAAAPAQTMSLTTSFNATLGQAGVMFDLSVSQPVMLQGINGNLDAGSWDVEIYRVTDRTTWVGKENDPGAWTLLGAAQGVSSFGMNLPTSIALPLQEPLLPGGPVGFYITVTNGISQNYNAGTSVGAVAATDGVLTIFEGSGNAYPFGATFTPRVFSGEIVYDVGLPSPSFQVNQPEASLRVNDVETLGFAPATSEGPHCETNLLAWNADAGALTFDLGFTAGGAVTPSLLTTPAGQILNVDPFAPDFDWVFGGAFTTGFFPGNVPFVLPSFATGFQVQMLVVNAASPDGFRLSQAADHRTLPAAAPVVGPPLDETGLVVELAPTCWLPAGQVSLYGVSYDSLVVSSNGRVTLGSTVAPDFSPSVVEALTGAPMIGNWADLSPNAGGTYGISSPVPGRIVIDYSGVPFFNETATATFAITFDAVGTWELSGLSGVQATAAPMGQFLGLSPGNGVGVDPGPRGFGPGVSGSSPAAGAMLYTFTQGSPQHAAIAAGLDSLLFTPDGSGGYGFVGF